MTFTSCSDEVEKILQVDVMKSVAYLIPDLLKQIPLLLYQGKEHVFISTQYTLFVIWTLKVHH